MAELPPHPTDLFQDAVDGRLDVAAREELDRHLAGCSACRQELDALTWVKRQLVDHARATSVPADLQDRLLRTLDAEDRRVAGGGPFGSPVRRAVPRRWWIGAVAAAAAVVAAVWLGTRPDRPTLTAEVAADFRAFLAGGLSLQFRTPDPGALEAQLGAAGLSFPARVFDFGMMDYRLAGGGVHQVAGRSSAMFAYDGPGALRLLCQMYVGTLEDLPSPAERRSNDGIEFLVYRDGDVTIVFWQEGSVVCVLAANGDAQSAIRLAFAKAIRV